MVIGLCVCTYNRLSYLKQCIKSLNKNNWGGATVRMVVDDCSTEDGYTEYIENLRKHGIKVIKAHINYGIATSKNVGLRYMEKEGCNHLFLMEDDILMQKQDTCIRYIDYANNVNIHHLNFGLHGTANIGKGEFNKDGIYVYPDCVGAFSYYTKECIEEVGYMDETFKNAWEHVEHTYRIIEAGMTTPLWQFADHPSSSLFLEEIPNSINNSVIRPRSDWKLNIADGYRYWVKKHGKFLPKRLMK